MGAVNVLEVVAKDENQVGYLFRGEKCGDTVFVVSTSHS
jgi:hypothetical protein